MIQPETEYVKLGDDYIAYQVVGEGPGDLLLVTGLAGGSVDGRWDFPLLARFLEELASFRRLILFDRRGCGASDRVPLSALTWEQWAADITAVMDAAGSERAAILTENDACPTGLVFAATYPDRVSELITVNGGARYIADEGFPGGVPPDTLDMLAVVLEEGWGREALVDFSMPSLAGDRRMIREAAKLLRTCTTPQGAAMQYRYLTGLDVSAVLPSIHVPTLIIQRENHPFVPVALSRHLAENISGARYVEVPGADVWCCGEGSKEILAHIEEFLTGARRPVDIDRVLATVLFTDIVGSTTRAADLGDKRWNELLDQHDNLTRSQVEAFGGRVVKTTGDGALATFDSPGRAIKCAGELSLLLRGVGINVRAGLHTGEVEKRGDDVGGIAVHIGARVMGEAEPGEVLCSRTVRDLVVGSGLNFQDRGSRALKGVPEEWQLFAVAG